MKQFIKTLLWRLRYARAMTAPELQLHGSVCILAPHPDDEALGCGGLISHLCATGNYPHVVIMTGGGGSLRGHSDISEDIVVTERRKLTLKSAEALGLPKENVHFLDFIDGSIIDRPESEISRLRNLITEIKPSAIFVPHNDEGWPDHLATRRIGIDLANQLTAVPKPDIYEYCVWMWYYNVWSLDWKNAYKFKMSPAEHEAKLRAVNEYILPLSPSGAPWSGILPKPFIKANTARTELFFKLTPSSLS